MVDLGTLGGSYSTPVAVNASGRVVGYSTTAGDAASHAVLWGRRVNPASPQQ
jgi:probable HAF family extracellular repeat protein